MPASTRRSLGLNRPARGPSHQTARMRPDRHRDRLGRSAVTVGLLCVIVLLTGCTDSDRGVGSASTPAPVAGSGTVLGDGTAAETEIYRESLDARWASIASLDPKAVRPETAIVRYVTMEEHFGLVADCVNEQGFAADLGADGGIRFGEVPKAQGTALNVAVYVCQASYPLEDKYTLPPTEDQLRRLYEYQANDSVACLTALGYTVSPPPSLQEFLDTFNTQDAWSPFAEALATATEEESIEANAACPQQPDDWWG
jgi:hypothetical protein